MLMFDFQLIHPRSQTNVFSLQNLQANNFMENGNRSINFNKLLCQSVNYPFSVAIVSLSWDFFRDPLTLSDPFNPLE